MGCNHSYQMCEDLCGTKTRWWVWYNEYGVPCSASCACV